jgi:hypothetical protein
MCVYHRNHSLIYFNSSYHLSEDVQNEGELQACVASPRDSHHACFGYYIPWKPFVLRQLWASGRVCVSPQTGANKG